MKFVVNLNNWNKISDDTQDEINTWLNGCSRFDWIDKQNPQCFVHSDKSQTEFMLIKHPSILRSLI